MAHSILCGRRTGRIFDPKTLFPEGISMRSLEKMSLAAVSLALVLGSVSVGVAQQKKVDGIPASEVEKVITPGQIPASPPPMGNPATGAALYENCVPCHSLKGNGIAGKTEASLMASMQNYQTGTFKEPKVQKMQSILRGLSQEQLMDLARYISKM